MTYSGYMPPGPSYAQYGQYMQQFQPPYYPTNPANDPLAQLLLESIKSNHSGYNEAKQANESRYNDILQLFHHLHLLIVHIGAHECCNFFPWGGVRGALNREVVSRRRLDIDNNVAIPLGHTHHSAIINLLRPINQWCEINSYQIIGVSD
jgi:hypothetical protein